MMVPFDLAILGWLLGFLGGVGVGYFLGSLA